MILKNKQTWNLFFLALILITACSTTPPTVINNIPPTVNPLYQQIPTETLKPTIIPTTPAPLPTQPTTSAESNLVPTKPLNAQREDITVIEAIPLYSDTRAEILFGDRLNPNWSVEHSWDTDIDLQNEENMIVGVKGIKIIPTNEFGATLFSVRDTARKSYLRDDVVGFRFWLYTDDDFIGLDDLIITLQGSNEYPYWVENDDSVDGISNLDETTFSETSLANLNVSRDIAPHTWINIELWIDDLLYDPDYEYVTGFYIKNDADFQRPYYIDDVEILLLKDAGAE